MATDKALTLKFNVQAVLDEVERQISEAAVGIVEQVQAEVTRLRAMGLSDEAIIAKLDADADGLTGIFAGTKTRIGGLASGAVNTANQAAYYQEIVDVGAEEYMWVRDPGADHCRTCPTKHGVVKKFEEWEAAGLPGSGVDECGHNCRCSLVPAEIMKGGPDGR